MDRPGSEHGHRVPPLSLVPLYAGEFLLFVANSIAFTAIAMRAHAAGFDNAAIGAAGSAYYAGLFTIFLASPAIVARTGLKTMVLSAAPVTLAGLAALVAPSSAVWLAGRFAMGIGIGLLVVALENWINLTTDRDTRARGLAIYMAVYLGSYVAGQLLLLLVLPTSAAALWIAGGSLVAGLGAFAASRPPPRPAMLKLPRGGAGRILRYAPVGVVAALVSGLAAAAFYALGPVYALKIGMSSDHVPAFMIIVIAGASFSQVALGIASDRFDRARLLAGIHILALAASLGLLLAEEMSWLVFVLSLIWGSTAPLGYATAAAIVYDAPHGRPTREVAQVVLVGNGIGGMLGPALASALDPIEPGKGLFVLATAVFAVLSAASFITARPSIGR